MKKELQEKLFKKNILKSLGKKKRSLIRLILGGLKLN